MLLEAHPEVQQILFKDDLWFLRGKGAIRGTKTSPLLYKDLEALKRVRLRFPERNITFSGKARVDTFVDPSTLQVDWSLLKATRSAGFVSVSMGIESFNQDDLVYFNKRLGINGPAVNKLAVRSVEAAGISSVSYVILANDTSTLGSIMENADAIVDLLEESPKHVIKLNDFLFPLPGTVLTEKFEKNRSHLRSETKRFQAPGFRGKYVDRVIKIYPNSPIARDLMTAFEENKLKVEQESQSELNIEHWISEFSTPAYIRSLYTLAEKEKLIDSDYARHQVDRLTQTMVKFRGENFEESMATITDA